MTKLYLILANKGGVGKSTIAAIVAEYLLREDSQTICIDLDPENATFCLYETLNVHHIQIKDNETNEIDKGKFDELIEIIIENKERNIVIDTGASTFNSMGNYFLENSILELLKEEEIELIIISIVAGGGNTLDSLQGFSTLTEAFDAEFIVFNNQLMGSTVLNGKQLYETKVYIEADNKGVILGTVNIPEKSEYITKDIVQMTKDRITFLDLKSNTSFKMMQKRRLIVYRNEIWNQLNEILGGQDAK